MRLLPTPLAAFPVATAAVEPLAKLRLPHLLQRGKKIIEEFQCPNWAARQSGAVPPQWAPVVALAFRRRDPARGIV
jgi:hypothetical protein